MNFEELQKVNVRLGDMLFETVHYSSLGDSTYGGIIVSTNPIVIYPYSGNNGYHIPSRDNSTYRYARLPFILRMQNIIGSYRLIRKGGK